MANEPKQFNQPAKRSFESLAEGVRDWITSDAAGQIIEELNVRHSVDDGAIIVIPRLITRLLTGMLDPENLHPALKYYLPLLNPRQIADIAISVKNRLLKPIGNSLKGLYAIDIERIQTAPLPETPTARTMTIESKPDRPVQPPSRPTPVPQSSQAAPLKARVMEMAPHVIDLRRTPTTTKKPEGKPASFAAGAGSRPEMRTMAIQPGTGFTGGKPSETPMKKAAAPTGTDNKNEGEATVLEARRPFGLAEAEPEPPTQQPAKTNPDKASPSKELTKYHDEHPMVE